MTCVHLILAQPHSDVDGGDKLGFWHKVYCRVRLPSSASDPSESPFEQDSTVIFDLYSIVVDINYATYHNNLDKYMQFRYCNNILKAIFIH